MMKGILTFLLLAFANKLVRGNLPDLNLGKGFQKYIAPLLFLGYLSLLRTAIKITKNPEEKKSLQYTFMILTTAIVLMHAMANKKSKTGCPIIRYCPARRMAAEQNNLLGIDRLTMISVIRGLI